ncbi:E3 ubiquitin-protein ligase family [Quillaja saponaria]|uniref:RING-type E3 ubiquitin transferase n=1 Tax=Quillaja saponaria TaxID=32244 RepID=A0AAD7P7E5_QUISA|nr:E3 ubiquitin-protein ligase family [Quillaja saponaria]KAJ7944878.1 E3 ubiquitin-protein ligase family [Quillaja saponaria]
MATTRSPNRSSEDIVDTTPFLGNSGGSSDEINYSRRFVRRQSLRQAARFLRQASSRRMMREPSMLVRETAAEQLEERQSDWAYSKPVVILDIIWNLSFVIVASTVLVLSRSESPIMPLRLWIVGYALQCILHMVCVCVEYRRRIRQQQGRYAPAFSSAQQGIGSSENLNSGLTEDSGQYITLAELNDESSGSVAKHLESANTMFSFIWWIIGFYWASAGGQALEQGSPRLYWLCIVFLGFDVFFVVFCVALACIIGIAVCCCLPCIIALLYAVADQEGASKEDIEQLSKFKFRRVDNNEKLVAEVEGPLGGIMTECGTDSPMEHALAQEDAECCICLSAYEDGVELRELPCGHHFHCACVDKWLYINATCPLCKYNILKSSNCGQEEV